MWGKFSFSFYFSVLLIHFVLWSGTETEDEVPLKSDSSSSSSGGDNRTEQLLLLLLSSSPIGVSTCQCEWKSLLRWMGRVWEWGATQWQLIIIFLLLLLLQRRWIMQIIDTSRLVTRVSLIVGNHMAEDFHSLPLVGCGFCVSNSMNLSFALLFFFFSLAWENVLKGGKLEKCFAVWISCLFASSFSLVNILCDRQQQQHLCIFMANRQFQSHFSLLAEEETLSRSSNETRKRNDVTGALCGSNLTGKGTANYWHMYVQREQNRNIPWNIIGCCQKEGSSSSSLLLLFSQSIHLSCLLQWTAVEGKRGGGWGGFRDWDNGSAVVVLTRISFVGGFWSRTNIWDPSKSHRRRGLLNDHYSFRFGLIGG